MGRKGMERKLKGQEKGMEIIWNEEKDEKRMKRG